MNVIFHVGGTKELAAIIEKLRQVRNVIDIKRA